jgi:redox-sensitive bicupin YhaK (pirin superfamily)
MSYHEADEPQCTRYRGAIELIIEPRERELGGFSVRRVLPARERRMVGPFIFFDHVGPAEFPPGEGIQVRPHPHIGLATVTYLFDGEIMHRDSLGLVQAIRPGAVNLMTAGSGIVHSERAGGDLEEHSRLHGIQSWMALPIRVIMGEFYGHDSPVTCHSPTLYLECRMPKGTRLALPLQHEELAAYVVDGSVAIDRRPLGAGQMAIASTGMSMRLQALEESRVMVIGGATLGRRHIWWNFVSSSRERIEQAKSDWAGGQFDDIPGDEEFIPLPV